MHVKRSSTQYASACYDRIQTSFCNRRRYQTLCRNWECGDVSTVMSIFYKLGGERAGINLCSLRCTIHVGLLNLTACVGVLNLTWTEQYQQFDWRKHKFCFRDPIQNTPFVHTVLSLDACIPWDLRKIVGLDFSAPTQILHWKNKDKTNLWRRKRRTHKKHDMKYTVGRLRM